jgi:hypothetical protein
VVPVAVFLFDTYLLPNGPVMAKQWYYAKEGTHVGPVSAVELQALAAKGQLQPTDRVWAEGQKDWIRARKVRGLFPARSPPGPRTNPRPTPGESKPVNVPNRAAETSETDRSASPFAFDQSEPPPDDIPQRFTAAAKGRGLPRARVWIIVSAVASIFIVTAAVVGVFGGKSSDEVLRIDVESGLRSAVAFSLDGRTVLLGRPAGEPLLAAWDIQSGKTDSALKKPPRTNAAGEFCMNLCVGFSPDGRRLLFGGSRNKSAQTVALEEVVRVWDIAGGKEIKEIRGHGAGEDVGVIFAVATSADGRTALSCTMGGKRQAEAILWDLAGGREIRRVRSPGMAVYCCAAVSAHGSLGLVGGLFTESADSGMSRVEVISQDGRSKVRHADFDRNSAVQAVAIAPGGRRALVGGSGKTIRLIDLGTMKEIRQLTGHTSEVAALAISADGRRAVSGSHDHTVRVWDLATGHELRCYTGHKDAVRGVAISPDGRRAASISSDSTLRVWKMPE